MEQLQEGFDQFQQKNMYVQTKLAIDKIIVKNTTKNNNKMIYKSPLTIFQGVNLCELSSEIQLIPQNLNNNEKLQQSQTLSDQQIQPLKEFLFVNTKNLTIENEETQIQQQKLNEYFPKKYICAYNKFSQNLFLKNDLTIFIKNISRCIQLQMLFSFKGYASENFQQEKDFTNEAQNKKEKKPINSSPYQKKNLQAESRKTNIKLNKKTLSKSFDQLRIQKSILKKSFHKAQTQEVQFFSNFQSGNLHLAFVDKKNPRLYYLMLTNDINTHGCNQWFYFGVRVKGNRTCRFNIMNISKEFKYEENMKILSYSKGSWKRARPYLCYKNKFLRYHGGNLVSIDFQYQFNKQLKFEQANQACQQVFFAFSYPYTYSKLLNFVKQVSSIHYVNLFVTVQSLGKTQATNYIPIIKIQSSYDKKIVLSKKNKPVILFIARQHASQTASSFIVEQIIKKLTCSESQLCCSLLNKYEFHIIPMANPDGVAHGNSRTNIKGYDINRCWQKGRSIFTKQTVQTQCMNKYIQNLLQTKKIDYAIDLHSHSKDFGSFAYFSQKNQISKLFSYFFSQNFQECRYNKCRVDLSYKKKQTFRGQMYYNLGIKNSITIQTSYYGYKKILNEDEDQKQLIPFTLQNYSNIAYSILNALNQIANYSKYSQKGKQIAGLIEKLDIQAARLRQKAKWKGQYQSSNQSDSAPQQDFLQIKQRKQMGENLLQAFLNANNQPQKQQQQPKGAYSKKEPNQLNVFLTQSKVLESKNEIRQLKKLSQTQKKEILWEQKLRQKKRKRIYTSSNIQNPHFQNILQNQEKAFSSLNHYQLTKKYASLDKSLQKRSTLRNSIKNVSSKSIGYRSLSEHKKRIERKKIKQMLEQQKTITYPTACDIKISYANIRIMHQDLHKNRIKVKDIKNQTLVRKFRNQNSFHNESKNDVRQMKETLSKLSQSFVAGTTIKKLQY